MNLITCLADILAYVPRVRVIKEWDENYGKEFDIIINNHSDRVISIAPWDQYLYDYSEIQFLTPVKYEWRYIGIGDKVISWSSDVREVYGYSFCGEWIIDTTKDYYLTVWIAERDIKNIQPLHQLKPKIELSSEEMIEELQRRGKIFYVNGDVIMKDITNN